MKFSTDPKKLFFVNFLNSVLGATSIMSKNFFEDIELKENIDNSRCIKIIGIGGTKDTDGKLSCM